MIGSPASDHVNAVAFAGELVPSVMFSGLMLMLRKASRLPGLRMCLVRRPSRHSSPRGMPGSGGVHFTHQPCCGTTTGARLKAGIVEPRGAAGGLSELLEGSVY